MLNRIKISPQLILISIVGLITFFVITFAVISLFEGKSQPQDVSPRATPTSAALLNPKEKAFPKATPQPFRYPEESNTGTLVVTANVDSTKVFLDTATRLDDPKNPISSGQPWPYNLTPFTVDNMSIGKHSLEAIKYPGYDMVRAQYEIKKGQITRVYLKLVPLQAPN